MVGVSVNTSIGLRRARKRIGSVCRHFGYNASDIAAAIAYKFGSMEKNHISHISNVAMMCVLSDLPYLHSFLEEIFDVGPQRVLYSWKRKLSLEIQLDTEIFEGLEFSYNGDGDTHESDEIEWPHLDSLEQINEMLPVQIGDDLIQLICPKIHTF